MQKTVTTNGRVRRFEKVFKCTLLLLLWGIAANSQSQKTSLSGTVLNDQKEPMERVTVGLLQQGDTLVRTTSTTAEGYFYFKDLDTDARYQLTLTAVGYAKREMKGIVLNNGANNSMLIHMVAEPRAMDEVVITGYGGQNRSKVAGAVSQITAEVLEDRPSPGLTRLLQGTLPNLNIKMVDGSPTRGASYNVRGITSIGAGGSALVLIDGVEGNPELINPNDIETVTVLKDASSAAIYGSRAAFGVVLITTKNPKKGGVKVGLNSNYSLSQRTVTPELITNGYEWSKNFVESFTGWYDYNSYPTVVNNIFPFSLEYLDRLKAHEENPSLSKVTYNESLGRYEYFGNTDWFKELYKDQIPSTEHAVNVSGGADKINYFLSGRYYSQDGIFRNNPDKFKRYNMRAKGTIDIAPGIQVQNNFELSASNYSFPLLADRDNQTIWRMMDLLSFPMATIYNPDGSLTHTAVYSGIGSLIDGHNKSETSDTYLRNTIGLVIKPFRTLTLKGDFTYSANFGKEKRVNNYVDYSNAPNQVGRLGRSLLQQFNNDKKYWAANITAEYAKRLNNIHDVKALIGYNAENSDYNTFNGSRDGLLVSDRPDFNLMDGLNYTLAGGGNSWAYLGAFYRFNYSLMDRYIIEFNGRYDGSSKFPESQRYGFFPSVAAGWRINKETFLSGASDWLNEWKIRGSFGSLGNGNVDPYRYMEQMGISKMSVILNGVQNNYTQLPGVVPDGLTWERSTTFDLGTDIAAFRNRLNIYFDWYDRKTTDMFTAGQPLPAVFGASVPYGNYADLSTKGWELALGWKDKGAVFGRPFEYGFSGSLWDSKSTVTKFNNPTGTLASTYYVGHTIGEIWGYTTEGLFRSEEEITNHADQAFLQNSNNRKQLPGDIKFLDRNGDGFINEGNNTIYNPGDRGIIGNSAPRYQFGFTLSARWNGIGISAFFQGIGKRNWYFAPEAGMFWGLYNRPYGFQSEKMMRNVWTENNVDAYFPRLRGYTANSTARALGAPQTRYLQDASYLRFKNLTVDYQLPAALVRKWHMGSATIFFTTQNLFTFSGMYKYTNNIDVEIIENPVGDLQNNSGQGYAYPMLKTSTIGVNLTF